MAEGFQTSAARLRAAGGSISRTPVSFREQKRRRAKKKAGTFTGRTSENIVTANEAKAAATTTGSTTSSAQLRSPGPVTRQQFAQDLFQKQQISQATRQFFTETINTVAGSKARAQRQSREQEQQERQQNILDQQRISRQLKGAPLSQQGKQQLQSELTILGNAQFGSSKPIPGTLREAVVEQVPARRQGIVDAPVLQKQPTITSRATKGARAGADVIGFIAGEPFRVAGEQAEKLGTRIERIGKKTKTKGGVVGRIGSDIEITGTQTQAIGQTATGFGKFFKEEPVKATAFAAAGGALDIAFKGLALGGQTLAAKTAVSLPTTTKLVTGIGKTALGAGAVALGGTFAFSEIKAITSAPKPFERFGKTLGEVTAIGVGARAGGATFTKLQDVALRSQARLIGAKKVSIEQIAQEKVFTGKQKFPLAKGRTQEAKALDALNQFKVNQFKLKPVKGVQVFSATTQRFPSQTTVLPGRGATSPVDPEGLFVAPSVSTRFLRLTGEVAERPSKIGLLPELSRPTIVSLDIATINRLPSAVRRGSTGTEKQRLAAIAKGDIFLESQAGRDAAFITSRLEAGFTSEAEAVIPAGTKLRRTTAEPFTEFTELQPQAAEIFPVGVNKNILSSGFSLGKRSPLITNKRAVPIVQFAIEETGTIPKELRKELGQITGSGGRGSSSLRGPKVSVLVSSIPSLPISSIPTTSLSIPKLSLVSGRPITSPSIPLLSASVTKSISRVPVSPVSGFSGGGGSRRTGGGSSTTRIIEVTRIVGGSDSRVTKEKEELFPFLGGGLGFVGGKRRGAGRSKRKFKYAPSLVAIEKQIKGKRPKVITGFGVRPLKVRM